MTSTTKTEVTYETADKLYDNGKFDECIQILNKLLQNDEANFEYNHLYACALYQMKDINLADKFYKLAIKYSNEEYTYIIKDYICFLMDNGKLKECGYYINKCLKLKVESKHDLMTIGNYYGYIFNKGHCINSFNQMLKLDDSYYEGILEYARALYEFGDHNKALLMIDKIKSDDLNTTLKYYMKGVIYFELGDTNKALINLKKYHKFTEDYNCAYLCYVLISCNEMVSKIYLQKMKNYFDENDKIFLLISGYFEWKIHKNSSLPKELLEESLNAFLNDKSLNKIYQFHFHINYCYLILGMFYLESKLCNFNKALYYFNKLIEIKPYFVAGHYYKSITLFKLKEYKQSLKSLEYGYNINKNIQIMKENYHNVKRNIKSQLPTQEIEIDLDNNYKKEFELWLCNIVKKPQYLQSFQVSDCNDIRMIQDLDEESLLDIGVKKLHIKLFIRNINNFKTEMSNFNVWLNNNLLNKYSMYLDSIGIITLQSFISLLTKLKNNPEILIDNLNNIRGIPFTILQKIYHSLNIKSDYFVNNKHENMNVNDDIFEEQIEGLEGEGNETNEI